MDEGIGIACGACDTFTPMGGPRCVECGTPLSLDPPEPPASERALEAPIAEESMEQARHYVCKQCSSPVPPGHKFCGACGAVVPPEALQRQVEYFGPMQAPGKARLVLIRGEQGVEGLTFLLQGTEHVAGRKDGQIVLPGDVWVSPRHANFIYRGEKLVVRDEGSHNGVYVRVKQPTPIEPGTQFLCGEQVFRLDPTPRDTSGPDPDQTYFYSSPRRPSPFRITQILRGGVPGMVFCARENVVTIGREDCDMNFPDDVYMSGRHARVELTGEGRFQLVDTASRNGTFVRIRGERELGHADYFFLGRHLFRVEMTA
ncbi:MAG: FHA domain-containing protein [Myxococcota bacterium]|nr:FHA domain-containing protein [Myxococcota bacterium]MDW8362392.1 FHA domain-containing protein [Myxococcales bacterium]